MAVLTRGFVMIARYVEYLRTLSRLAEDSLDHIVVRLRPVPPALQAPAIDDVADEV